MGFLSEKAGKGRLTADGREGPKRRQSGREPLRVSRAEMRDWDRGPRKKSSIVRAQRGRADNKWVKISGFSLSSRSSQRTNVTLWCSWLVRWFGCNQKLPWNAAHESQGGMRLRPQPFLKDEAAKRVVKMLDLIKDARIVRQASRVVCGGMWTIGKDA